MLNKIWSNWKKIAEKIGNFQATIIFSILFFILVTPFGVISKLFTDLLKAKGKPGWEDVLDNTSTFEKLSQQ